MVDRPRYPSHWGPLLQINRSVTCCPVFSVSRDCYELLSISCQLHWAWIVQPKLARERKFHFITNCAFHNRKRRFRISEKRRSIEPLLLCVASSAKSKEKVSWAAGRCTRSTLSFTLQLSMEPSLTMTGIVLMPVAQVPRDVDKANISVKSFNWFGSVFESSDFPSATVFAVARPGHYSRKQALLVKVILTPFHFYFCVHTSYVIRKQRHGHIRHTSSSFERILDWNGSVFFLFLNFTEWDVFRNFEDWAK